VLGVLYCVVLWQCLSIPLLGGDPSLYYLVPSYVGRTTPSFLLSRSAAAEGAQDEVTGWNMTGVGLTCFSKDALVKETNQSTLTWRDFDPSEGATVHGFCNSWAWGWGFGTAKQAACRVQCQGP